MEDLALEDACYRISESSAKEIVKKVQERGFNEGEDIGLFRVPVLDRRLLLNLLKNAETASWWWMMQDSSSITGI